MTKPEALEQIIKAAEVLGWNNISFPCTERVPGMILGTKKYLDWVLSGLPNEGRWSPPKPKRRRKT